MSSFPVASSQHASGVDPKKTPVMYPDDRRLHFWIRRSMLAILLIVALIPFVVAWLQYLVFGLPGVPASPHTLPDVAGAPHGFPAWLRITHYVNFFFIILLARSGLSILADHPRLYWNIHSQIGRAHV